MSPSSRFKPCLLALACSALLLNAAPAVADSKATPKPAPASKASPPPLSSPQLLAQMLLSEIALSRGLLEDAAFGYSDLARRSNDERIQRRASEIELVRIMQYTQTRPAEAESALRTLLAERKEQRERLLLQLPGIYSRSADKSFVLQTIQRLTAPYASLAEARYSEGIAQRDAGDISAAYAAARQASQIKPDWEPAILLLAQTSSDAQRTESRELLARFSQRNPQALDARVALIRWLAQDSQTAEARSAASQLLADYPERSDLAFAMAGVAVETGDLSGAETILSKLLEQNWGETDRLHLLLAQVQAEEGKFAEALAGFDQVEPGPHFVTAQSSKARLLASRKQVSQARASLRVAMSRVPEERANLLVQESLLLRQLDDPKAAFSVLNEALRDQPDNLEALYDSALLAEQLGQPAVLEERLKHLLNLQPNHAHASNALGYSLADRNLRLDEADQLLTRALQLAPEDPAILDSMGWLRFRQHRLADAEQILRRAFALFPDPEVASHLIEVLTQSGQQDAARRQLQDALARHPGNPLLLQTGKRLGLN